MAVRTDRLRVVIHATNRDPCNARSATRMHPLVQTTRVDYGPIELSQGGHTLTFTASGKKPRRQATDSASNYWNCRRLPRPGYG